MVDVLRSCVSEKAGGAESCSRTAGINSSQPRHEEHPEKKQKPSGPIAWRIIIIIFIFPERMNVEPKKNRATSDATGGSDGPSKRASERPTGGPPTHATSRRQFQTCCSSCASSRRMERQLLLLIWTAIL